MGQTISSIFSGKEEPSSVRKGPTYLSARTFNASQATTQRPLRELDEWNQLDKALIDMMYQTRKREKTSGVKENSNSFYDYLSTVSERKTTSGGTPSYLLTASERKATSGMTPSYLSTTSVRKTTSGMTPSYLSAASERKTTSGVKPSYLSTTSERKTTSGVTPSYLSAASERKTTSGVKPSYLSTTSERKTTFGMKENTTSLPGLYDNNALSTEGNTISSSDMDDIKKITEIVRNILSRSMHGSNYVVYGNWLCHKWPISCKNEDGWQSRCTQETLQKYLKLSPEEKYDFFMRPCKGCNKKSLISSFFLYKQQPTYSGKEPAVEIICHLEWNNHYRVFAEWKCQRPEHPQHIWKSSYTWISLRSFIENTPAKDMKKRDFYTQKCHDCREECKTCGKKPKKFRGCKKCDHGSIVLNYSPLVQSGGGKPHKRWLCAKCQGGATCARTDKNYHVRRRRNIKLF